MSTGTKGAVATGEVKVAILKGGKSKGGESGVEEVKCGECKKVMGRSDKAVQCEICEIWFHSKCEGMSDDTYRLLGQDKIHFYCGRCDKVVGKILKTVSGIQAKQAKMEVDLNKIKMDVEVLKQKPEVELDKIKMEVEVLKHKPYVTEDKLEAVVKHFDSELKDIRTVTTQVGVGYTAEPEVSKLKTEWDELKSGMTSQINTTVKEMKDDLEESLEIERRRINIIIHGLKDDDAFEDVDAVMELFANGLKMDYDRHVDKMMRIGRKANPQKPRPLKVILKKVDSRKEILMRAKELKDTADFSRVFLTPDLTRKQQEKDKELRNQLKRFRDGGESTARIKYGKVVKNGEGGREVVLYQPPEP